METTDDELRPRRSGRDWRGRRVGGSACRPSSACPRPADADHEAWGPRDRAAREARVREHAARVAREEAALRSGRGPWDVERRALASALASAGGTLPRAEARRVLGLRGRTLRFVARGPWFVRAGGAVVLTAAGREAEGGGR
jgi:hypothetical protein